jgi:hypothetical protein
MLHLFTSVAPMHKGHWFFVKMVALARTKPMAVPTQVPMKCLRRNCRRSSWAAASEPSPSARQHTRICAGKPSITRFRRGWNGISTGKPVISSGGVRTCGCLRVGVEMEEQVATPRTTSGAVERKLAPAISLLASDARLAGWALSREARRLVRQ